MNIFTIDNKTTTSTLKVILLYARIHVILPVSFFLKFYFYSECIQLLGIKGKIRIFEISASW